MVLETALCILTKKSPRICYQDSPLTTSVECTLYPIPPLDMLDLHLRWPRKMETVCIGRHFMCNSWQGVVRPYEYQVLQILIPERHGTLTLRWEGQHSAISEDVRASIPLS